MQHNFLLHKNHPQQEHLEKVIGLILEFVLVDSIYFSLHLEDGINEGIIIVIVGENSPHNWDDISEYCWKIFESYPQFSFRIFDSSWFKDEIKAGNPFFIMHCSSRELLYSSQESSIFSIETLKSKRFLKKSKFRYEIETESSFTFGLNLRHYKNGKNYLQALYTLHQTLKYLYISASWFLSGEWFVTQDLATQQKHLGKFSKSLGKVFDFDVSKEAELLEKLNSSCYAVQNNEQAPEITLEIINVIELKAEWMRQEVKRLFNECQCRCQFQFSLGSSSLIEIDQSNPLKMISKTITDSIETIGIYCFGQRTISKSLSKTILDVNQVDFESNHFYLFVIVKRYKENFTADIADIIKNRTNGKYTVTILLQTNKSLFQKSSDKQYFFYQVIQKAKLIFQSNAKSPCLIFDEIPIRDINSTKRYIQQRNVIKNIFSVAEAMDWGNVTKVNIFMMHIVVEQTCLGLIRLFLGYNPNHFSLYYLFDLCEYFTPLTSEIFPRQTDKDKMLLKLLMCNMSSLRHGVIDEVFQHDYEVLSNRYYEFVERADELIIKELESLETAQENATLNNLIMEPKEIKSLEDLKTIAKNNFVALKPNKNRKGTFYVTITVDSYTELHGFVRDIINFHWWLWMQCKKI
jgi:hypothetical protein